MSEKVEKEEEKKYNLVYSNDDILIFLRATEEEE